MPLPKMLYLLRHGQSVANARSVRAEKNNDSSDFNLGTLTFPPALHPLSYHGREQARVSGMTLACEQEIVGSFNRHISSSYVRALETASIVGGPDARWEVCPYLGERSWGEAEGMPLSEMKKQFRRTFALMSRDPFNTRMPGGESILDVVVNRARPFIHDWLATGSDMDNVLVVSHGEMIGAIMAYLEGWDVLNWVHYIRNDKWRLHNCDLVIYSRSRERVPNRYFPFDQRVIAKFSFSEHCYEDRCETPLSEQRFARDAETLAIQAHLLGEARVPFFDPCR